MDDESSFRDITRSILEKYNYRVRVAPGGKEALAILQECPGKIKLVITDMMMPGMDGTATLQAIQKIDPTLRMMATSGMPIQEPFRPLPQGETVPFLLKPYDTPRLLETVHATLQSATPGPILSP